MPAQTSAAIDGARNHVGPATLSPSAAAPERQRRPLAAYAAGLLLLVLIAFYAVTAGRLALYRHWNLESQALDMGYADQITWNNLHGNLFRFTVFRGAVGHEQGGPLAFGEGADPDSLLAFHVELLFLPLAALYLIHAGPETLIVLLTAVLALGALPAYWIAHRRLDHRGAALAFAAMYLLSPAIQAANLADFHIVSMTGALLLFAWYFLLRGHTWAFVLMAGLCTLAKEEVGLIVGLMGVYAALVLRRRLLGITVAVLAFAWVALSFGVIIPYFSGGRASLFITRYAEAIALLRAYPGELLAGNLGWPVPGTTVTYLQHLLASSGVLALLGPLQLAVSAPALAINGLSNSTWQHGGGAHYSAEAIPALLVAAIFGTGWLAARAQRWLRLPRADVVLVLALIALSMAVIESRQEGILPPAKRFAWPGGAVRADRLAPLRERIPADAVVSAQSNVFPHLSGREKIYVFPTIDDAEYVLLDVAGTSDPLQIDELYAAANALLDNPQFALLAGDDGLLLFKRRVEGSAASGSAPDTTPPPAFYSFTRAAEHEPYTPVAVSFEELFEIVGYRLEALPEVRYSIRRVTPTLYVRPRAGISRNYRLTLLVVGHDNFLREVDSGNPTQLWHPTGQWSVGELIRLRYPPLTYHPGARLGIRVQTGTDAAEGRLRVTRATVPLLDQDRVAVLGDLP